MHSWDRDENLVWKIAIGVALGILVAGAIGFAVRAWLAHVAIQQLTEQTNKMLIQQQQAAQAARDRQVAERARRDREAAQLAADQQQARAAAADAAARKERAWARYYQRPARCENQPSNETLTECANEYIRAKRRFEVDYAAGKL